ncbi:hypothetical protein PAMP_020368 [Pampus punctatissimus]
MSDPDLIIPPAGGLKGSSSIVTPEMDNKNALMPPVLAIPPPLPPKRYQRCATFEKTLGQGPELKAFDKDNKPLNSLTCQTSVLGGVMGNNQYLDLVPGEEVEPKCPPQLPPKPPDKAPIKPPRLNKPNRPETEEEAEGRKQDVGWKKHKEKMGDKASRQEMDHTERHEKMEGNDITSGAGSNLDMGKPLQQMVLYAENEKDGEERTGKQEVEDPEDIGLTTLTITDKSSQLTIEDPDMAARNTNTASTISAKPETKPPSKFHQKCPPKPPIKPLQLFSAMRTETVEEMKEKREEAEWEQHKEKMENRTSRQEPNQIDRNEKTEGKKQKSGTESQLDVGKPSRQVLVIFTDNEKDGEESKGRKEVEYPGDIWLTTPTMTDKSSQLAMQCPDLCLQEESDMAAGNTNTTSTVSVEPEPTLLPQTPPKPHRKCPPKPPIKSQLFRAVRPETEQEKQRRNQDKQKENENLVDCEMTSPFITDTSSQLQETVVESIGKSPANQESELPREGKRFCLSPSCRNKPMPVLTAENQTPPAQSQEPGRQRQNTTENGQDQPGPLPVETDSTTKTVKLTEHDIKYSQMISTLPSGFLEGTEVVRTKLDVRQLELKKVQNVQEIAETLSDIALKQTNQKSNAGGKVKRLAKRMMGKLKEGREERRRIRAGEMEMDGVREQSSEVTKDVRRLREKGEIKDDEKEEEEEGIEVTVDQSAIKDTQSHANPMERRIKRKDATSQSPFSSFKVCSPVNLVGELLSGDEWSPFLYRDLPPDPILKQTDSEDTDKSSLDTEFNPNAELDLGADVFEGNPAVTEEEHVYEDIDLLNMNITEERQTHGVQEENRKGSRTKDIFDTVEFLQPVLHVHTYIDFSDIQPPGVLDNSVQKYIIKLSKKRKHRARRKQHCDRNPGKLCSNVHIAESVHKDLQQSPHALDDLTVGHVRLWTLGLGLRM